MKRDIARRIMALFLSICMVAGMVDLTGFTSRAEDESSGQKTMIDQCTVEQYKQTYTYNGKEQHPEGIKLTAPITGEVLTEGVDYEIIYPTGPSGTNAGDKYMEITGIGKYDGNMLRSYVIVPKHIDLVDGNPSDVEVQKIPRVTYTDEGDNPVEVKLTDKGIDNGVELKGAESGGPVSGCDYYYSFIPPVDKENDQGSVVIVGSGNYTGSITVPYDMEKLDPKNLKVEFKQSYIYYSDRYTNPNSITKVTYKWKDGTTTTLKQGEDEDYTAVERDQSKPTLEAGVDITGHGIFNGLKASAYFPVYRRFSRPEIKVEIKPQVYTGQPITLDGDDVTVTDIGDDNYVLEYGKDYEIGNYTKNTDEGTATCYILGGVNGKLTNNNPTPYMGYKVVTFEIKAATLQTIDINVDDSKCVYDGTKQVPAVTIGDGELYKEGEDYTVDVTSGGINAGTNTSTITITPRGGKLKGDPEPRNYSIQSATLTNESRVTMELADSSPKVYSGDPIEPKVVLTFIDGENKTVVLDEGTDYDLSWSSNVNAGTGRVTATGKGNFKDSISCFFEIAPAPFTDVVVADIPDQIYSGREFKLLPSVTMNKRTLNYGVDYDLTWSNNENAGEASIVITGKGNYTPGSVTKTFKILPQDIDNSQVRLAAIPQQTYTGQPLTPEVSLTYNGKEIPVESYTVSWSNNLNAGSNAIITITAKENTNFKGTRTEKFTINRRSIAGEYLVAYGLDEICVHTGDPIEDASIQMIYHKEDEGISTTLVENTDYKLSYSNNIEPGEATITVEGLNNFSGTKKFNFKIIGDLSNTRRVRVENIPDQTYTGSPIDASDMVVKYQTKNGEDGWKTLTKDRDYTVTYEDNTEVGTAKAVIYGTYKEDGTGSGFFGGETEEHTFKIIKKNLDTVTENDRNYVITGIEKEYDYTGTAIEPTVSITYYGKDLEESTDNGETGDYIVSYGENTNAGTGTVTITGVGKNFTGSLQRRFDIKPYDITSGTGMTIDGVVEEVILDNVKAIDDNTRTDNVALDKDGKVVQTNLSVMRTAGADTITLESKDGKDYSVSYNGNDDVGTATITFEGHGNYTGKMTRTFAIRGDLSNETSTRIADIPDYPYTPSATGVSANTPIPEVTYRDKVLDVDIDYSVSYRNNENVGDTATVTATAVADGNYVNSISKTFTIVKRELKIEEEDSDITVEGIEEDGYEYTGEEIRPEIRVLCKGVALRENLDYTVSYANNINVPAKDAEEEDLPTITITAVEDSNYTGEIVLPFAINARQVTEENVEVANVKEEYDYANGESIVIPHDQDEIEEGKEVTVTYVKGGLNIPLVEDVDYTMEYINNYQIGTAIIRITGINNYDGVLDQTFRIMGNINTGMEAGYITLDYDEEVPYGIVAVYPKLIFTDTTAGPNAEPKILVEGEDFEIVEEECSNNINVASKGSDNPPTVTVQGIGCYRGKVTRTYTIVPKNLTTDEGDITASFSINGVTSDSFIYTGSAIEPQVKVYNHNVEMTKDVDYILGDYRNNVNVPAEDAHDYEKPGITIIAIPNGNYIGSKTVYFDIEPKPIENMRTEITDGEQVYNRQEKKPAVRLYYTENGQEITVPSDSYDIEYENNLMPAEANATNAPMYTITGKGNYTGEISGKFAIEKESLDADDFNVTAKSAVYTGYPVITEITLFEAKDGTPLVENEDYWVRGYSDNTQAGTGYVTVEGLGAYTGERQVPFDIIPAKGVFHIDEIPAQIYNTKQIKPEVKVWLAVDTEMDSAKEGLRIDLTEDDYEIAYGENVNVGTGTVRVTGTGNFSGSAEAEFAIEPKEIGTKDDGSADSIILSPIEDQLYTGVGVRPELQLTFTNDEEEISSVLEEGKDYRVSYESNVRVGTAEVTIVGMGNYSGTLNTTFRILGNIELAFVEDIPVQEYTGSQITPKPVVSFAGETLEEGIDYTLAYKDNVERGTATITITAITGPDKWYGGTKDVTFIIAREFSQTTAILGVAPAYIYTGKAIIPSIVLRDDGVLLSPGTDYTVTYTDNINVGEVTVTVTGLNKYTGTITTSFRILPQSVGRVDVSNIADQIFDGKKKEPSVRVTNGTVVLRQDTDYTIQYGESTSPGQAKVYIKGKGNYTGTKIVNYNIIVPKLQGVKVAKYTKNSVTFSWNRNSVVTGYEIYNSANRRAVHVTKNTQTSATVSKLSAATSSTFRVRAYVVSNGRYYYSDFTNVKGTTAPNATKITSLTSTASKKVAAKWKKVSGATGYQIYRSTSKNGKYKKIASTKKTSYTDKKATKGKKYYYKVRAYKKVGSTNYYSSYSSPKGVTAMK